MEQRTRNTIIFAVIVVIGYWYYWNVSHHKQLAKAPVQHQKIELIAMRDGLPVVREDEDIQEIRVAPDCSRIGLYLSSTGKRSVAIVDPVSKKFVTTDADQGTHLKSWSPNGKWLAFKCGPYLKLISKDGTVTSVTDKPMELLTWRANDPSKLVYLEGQAIHEYDAETAKDRVVRKTSLLDCDCSGLFATNKRVLIAYYYEEGPLGQSIKVEITDADSGGKVLSIPCHDWRLADIKVSISPDEKMLFLETMGYHRDSNEVYNIVGLIKDAPTLLKENKKALYSDDDGRTEVLWTPGQTTKWAIVDTGYAEVHHLLSLPDGKLIKEFAQKTDYDNTRHVFWWKPDGKDMCFLLSGDEGIWIQHGMKFVEYSEKDWILKCENRIPPK